MTPSADRVRLDSLTGLRFPAALAVFAYHAAKDSAPGQVHDVAVDVAGRGYVGVSFFFVLSGFVLTWSHRADDTPRAFFRRRFARIAPVYWLCLIGTVLLLTAGAGDPAREVGRSLPSFLALQAWFPDPAIHFAANGPGWSISAEAFFYALFPLLIVAAASKRGLGWLAVSALVLTTLPALILQPSVAETTTAAWAIYVFPVTRLADFMLGIVVARALQGGWRPPVGLGGALVLAALAYAATAVVPAWMTVSLLTILPFALVIAAAAHADLHEAPSWFRSPMARRLGQWSFAFYLIHAPVLKVQHEVTERAGLSTAIEWCSIASALLVAVALAGVTYRFFEQPLERRLRHARPRVESKPPERPAHP